MAPHVAAQGGLVVEGFVAHGAGEAALARVHFLMVCSGERQKPQFIAYCPVNMQSVSHGQIRLDNGTCCHTVIKDADPPSYFTQSHRSMIL